MKKNTGFIRLFQFALHPLATTAILQLMLSLSAQAQQSVPAAADKELQAIFKKVKEADGYTYDALVEFSYPADTHVVQVQHMICYNSPSAYIFYMSTDRSLFLLSKKGEFTVDSSRKTVLYSIIKDEEQLRKKQQELNRFNQGMVDSVLLRMGSIKRKTLVKQKLKYELVYPASCTITDLEVTAHSKTYFPEKIVYTITHPITPATPDILIDQKMTTTGYVQQMPQGLKILLDNEDPLPKQLLSLYPGYKLQEKNN